MNIPRPEYPRPDFVRKNWINFNGTWAFEFDDEDKGIREAWFQQREFSKKIVVPFPFQSELSGIGEKKFHDVFWYRRQIDVPMDWTHSGRILLHIGAFDYHGMLWIDGAYAGEHKGGYTPWDIDITELFKKDRADIVIRGLDTQSKSQPRGKQHWELESSGILYTRASGAWQTIWLEHVPYCYIKSFHIVPALNPDRLGISFDLWGKTPKVKIAVTVSDEEKAIVTGEILVDDGVAAMELQIPNAKRWSPDDPFLYNILFQLYSDNQLLDEVKSYAGIRTVRRKGRQILLNGEPIRFKAVLDQGFFPDGIYTPPTEEAIKKDVELTRQLGFNGARKHQKVEDPLWYYWCDKLGLLVWGEMGNAWEFTPESCNALALEWPQAVRRDWNHPSIIAWVPINESWGVPEVKDKKEQQDFQVRMAKLTRELDPSRLVVDNSGWTHIDTDIIDLHPYHQEPEKMTALLEEILTTGKGEQNYPVPVWAGEGKDEGQPVVISEYGGIGLIIENKEEKDWGYGNLAQTPEELVQRFRGLTQAILANPDIAGYTYTQLTDVEQEMNGLLTYDRKPKAKMDNFAQAQTDPANKGKQ